MDFFEDFIIYSFLERGEVWARERGREMSISHTDPQPGTEATARHGP